MLSHRWFIIAQTRHLYVSVVLTCPLHSLCCPFRRLTVMYRRPDCALHPNFVSFIGWNPRGCWHWSPYKVRLLHDLGRFCGAHIGRVVALTQVQHPQFFASRFDFYFCFIMIFNSKWFGPTPLVDKTRPPSLLRCSECVAPCAGNVGSLSLTCVHGLLIFAIAHACSYLMRALSEPPTTRPKTSNHHVHSSRSMQHVHWAFVLGISCVLK